jgi:hypothetical protein
MHQGYMLDLKYVPQGERKPPPITSYTTRCKRVQDMQTRRAAFAFQRAAEVVAARVRTWYNPTNLFENATAARQLQAAREYLLEMTMARKPDPKPAPTERQWKGFLERRLSGEELEALDQWEATDTDLVEGLVGLLESGYELKLSYNPTTKAACCTLIDRDGTRKTAGWALSTFDTNGPAALKASLYKHLVALEGDWLQLLGQAPTSRRG